MDIQQATYAELRTYRDQIETRMKELEEKTLEDIERKAREFGFMLRHNPVSQAEPPKQKRKRRTKEEIAAANAVANGGAVME